ncbi:MAG: pyridoxamine 5'-phosphate oxidase family protein [Ferruginibacter sp.]
MNESITEFIEKQTCATVCCVDKQGQPWCFSCYYAVDTERGLLHFKSSPGARHAGILAENPRVAGTVLPDKLSKLVVKGIQFEGSITGHDDPLATHALGTYLRRHPMAVAIAGDIWTIRLDHIKLTDSKLGFGKKINWERG